MPSYAFRLLNVFAESTFGGNPLCVFEDAQGMSDDVMLKLARQFNLSETTFILPSDCADAYVYEKSGDLQAATDRYLDALSKPIADHQKELLKKKLSELNSSCD